MSTATSKAYVGSSVWTRRPGGSIGAWARSYFASDARRAIVSALGGLWLLDGALQLQPFMYSGGFISLIREGAAGQPQWLAGSIGWASHIFASDPAAWNTTFALIQVVIGLGLLYRPTVKPALALSFGWALTVWWVGEAFGFLMMQMTSASALTGAPGAAVLYLLIGAAVWPGRRAGGLLGARGVRAAWATLWLLMAWLWLQFQNSSPQMIAGQIKAEAPSGMAWLTGVQHWAAGAVAGNGLWIALVLAALSAAIGIAVAADWHARPFLVAAIVLNLLYWVVGQGFGGIFTGEGTDPNSGPLFILFALVLYTLIPRGGEAEAIPHGGGAVSGTEGGNDGEPADSVRPADRGPRARALMTSAIGMSPTMAASGLLRAQAETTVRARGGLTRPDESLRTFDFPGTMPPCEPHGARAGARRGRWGSTATCRS